MGVVTYLHCVVSGSDQIRWKPSRWARSIGSSLKRAVSIAGDCFGCMICNEWARREDQNLYRVRDERLRNDTEIEFVDTDAWGSASLEMHDTWQYIRVSRGWLHKSIDSRIGLKIIKEGCA